MNNDLIRNSIPRAVRCDSLCLDTASVRQSRRRVGRADRKLLCPARVFHGLCGRRCFTGDCGGAAGRGLDGSAPRTAACGAPLHGGRRLRIRLKFFVERCRAGGMPIGTMDIRWRDRLCNARSPCLSGGDEPPGDPRLHGGAKGGHDCARHPALQKPGWSRTTTEKYIFLPAQDPEWNQPGAHQMAPQQGR